MSSPPSVVSRGCVRGVWSDCSWSLAGFGRLCGLLVFPATIFICVAGGVRSRPLGVGLTPPRAVVGDCRDEAVAAEVDVVDPVSAASVRRVAGSGKVFRWSSPLGPIGPFGDRCRGVVGRLRLLWDVAVAGFRLLTGCDDCGRCAAVVPECAVPVDVPVGCFGCPARSHVMYTLCGPLTNCWRQFCCEARFLGVLGCCGTDLVIQDGGLSRTGGGLGLVGLFNRCVVDSKVPASCCAWMRSVEGPVLDCAAW